LRRGGPETARAPRRIAPALLAWYDLRRRDLPWRRQPSPYRTLVSEFMLQQTVVATVVPYFERFMARFPDLAALAASSEEQILTFWSGLGYYARARNLRRAAVAVMERHRGQIPDDEAILRALPGVGPYTAAAVAAIAFGRRTFALDGNAARVVARLALVTAAIDEPATRLRLRELGQAWVPVRRAGDFVQAIMELGATVCLPRVPRCGDCPLSRTCAGRGAGMTRSIPRRIARSPRRTVHLVSVRLRRAGRVLLVRRTTGLLAGTWMLPATVVADRDTNSASAARSAMREMGRAPVRVTPVGVVRHLFTHRDVTVEVFDGSERLAVAGGSDRGAPDRSPVDERWVQERWQERWVDERQLDRVAVSSFLRKQLALKRDKAREPP
jgi:A/G-specific adenine glycosylase